MTIIYEVNLKIAQSICAEYLVWLKGHMAKMCQQKGFMEATLFEEAPPAQNDSKEFSYIVHYRVANSADLQHYFEHHAQSMRQEAISLFGDQFTATRRILSNVEGYDVASGCP